MARTVKPRSRTRGCLLWVAAAGYGKTTVLSGGPDGAGVARYDAAELLAGVPELAAGRLAIDDVDELSARDQTRLARAITVVPDEVAIVLAARRPLAATAFDALPGPVTERGPADLALTPDAVDRVLREQYGVADPDLAHLVHGLTAGWPMLVHLAGRAAERQGAGHRDLLDALTEPGTSGAAWLREHVLGGLPPQAARLVELATDLDPVTTSLYAALGGTPTVDPVRWLVDTGLLVADPGARASEPAFRLVPVLSAIITRQRRGRSSRSDRGSTLAAAGAWYLEHGYPLAAARSLGRAGATAECAALVEARGDEILAAGGAAELTGIIDALPAAVRTPGVQLIRGDALRMAGDVAGAHGVFGPLIEGASGWPAALAWRVAMLHYMRADYRGALDLLRRAEPHGEAAAATADDAMVQACQANALHLLGENEAAAGCATRAIRLATAAGHDRAAAAAHIAAALTVFGVRRDEHLVAALAAAERAGDVVQQARVLVNQADHLLREARYPQALAVASRAVRAADLGAPPGMLVTALHNAGEALTRLGRYDEAFLHFERSMRICRRVGLNRVAAGLYGVAEVHRQLGRREQSRVAFEEAAELARATAEVQILVPALAGLARLLLDGAAPDVAAARAAAVEAEEVAPPMLAPRALVARGWVALFEGGLPLAQQRGSAAVRSARASRQADLLAESLELAAAVSAEPAAAREALQEAAAIWNRAGARPAADQLLVLIGRAPDAGGPERLAARAATTRLLALGVQLIGGSPLVPVEGAATPVRISVLGRFEVLVGGRPVPLPAWRSRQARTLLKILVARRGRPVARTELCELLWPDDDPQRTAHRLSVLLSAVRTVLDPTKLWAADHYLRADLAGISLDLTRVTRGRRASAVDAAHGHPARQGRRCRPGQGDSVRCRRSVPGRRVRRRAVRGLGRRLPRAVPGGLAAVAARARRAVAGSRESRTRRRPAWSGYWPPTRTTSRRTARWWRCWCGPGRHGEARRAHDRWVGAMRSIDAPLPDREVLDCAVVDGGFSQRGGPGGVPGRRAAAAHRQQGVAYSTSRGSTRPR